MFPALGPKLAGAAGRRRRRCKEGRRHQNQTGQARGQEAKGGIQAPGCEAEGPVRRVGAADASLKHTDRPAQENARQAKQDEPEDRRDDVLAETFGQPFDRKARKGKGIHFRAIEIPLRQEGQLGGVEALALQRCVKLARLVEDLALGNENRQEQNFDIPSERCARHIVQKTDAGGKSETGQHQNHQGAADDAVSRAPFLPVETAIEPTRSAPKNGLRMERLKKRNRKATEKRIDDQRDQKEKQGVGAPSRKGKRHAASMGRSAARRQCQKPRFQPSKVRSASMNEKSAILLCGHGSRDSETLLEFDAFVNRLRAKLPATMIGHGFLEFAEPTIRQGLEELRARGAQRIVVLPLMLFEGAHALHDIPALLQSFEAARSNLPLRYGRAFGVEEKLLAIVADRIREAEEGMGPGTREATFLLFVTRGARDAEVGRRALEMVMRLKTELGLAEALAAFSGIAKPSIEEGLRLAAQSGAKRVLVVPYFLFTGKLLKKLRTETEAVAAANTEIEFHVTKHLFGHPLLEEFLLDRIRELTEG